MIRRYIKILAATLMVLAMSFTTAFAAGNITINSKRAYDANNANVRNLRESNRTNVRGFEVKVTNDADESKKLSILIVKYEGAICKGVVVADAVEVDAHNTQPEAITVPCTLTSATDMVKCIIVEKTTNGLFPISTNTLKFGTTLNGWSTVVTE